MVTLEIWIKLSAFTAYAASPAACAGGWICKFLQSDLRNTLIWRVAKWDLGAKKNSAIFALAKQTPNQPLYDSLTEGALISFTLHNLKKDGDNS